MLLKQSENVYPIACRKCWQEMHALPMAADFETCCPNSGCDNKDDFPVKARLWSSMMIIAAEQTTYVDD